MDKEFHQYGDKFFQKVPPINQNSCNGCAMEKNGYCGESSSRDSCYDHSYPSGEKHRFIWVEVENKPKEISDKGVKYDSEKPRYDLLPPKALLEAVKNLTFGATKYAPENWKKVPEGRRRYFAAAQRHQWQWKSGETLDPENNLHHLAAAIVNLMFILEKELNNIPDVPDNSP